MNENRVNLPINFVHQEGAVLIVALILLVVLTMLGISGIESTKMETRMADNVRKYNVAFQRAESGIATTFNQCLDNAVKGNMVCSGEANANFTSNIENFIPANNSGSSLNRLVRLTTSTGTSDSVDPNAIQVTLMAGMWLPAAADNMMLNTRGKPCSLTAGEKDGITATCAAAIPKPTFGSDCASAIQTAIGAKMPDDAQKCRLELVDRVCKLPSAPPDCPTTIR